MRKPRDYDSELKALEQKARQLKSRRQSQLGELVIATGADSLASEELAGALLAAAGTSDRATKEVWRRRGAAFFSGERQGTGERATSEPASARPGDSSTPPASSEPGAA
nr:conjugal transfer protein TraD [Novosphingobium fluoreni]